MQDKNILITGGMGFIGPTVINRLKHNNDLVVIDRLDYGLPPVLEDSINKDFEFIESDLSEKSAIHERIALGEFDSIIHMASMSLIPVCENQPDYAYKSNTLSPLLLLQANVKKSVFLNFSTSAVYSPAEDFHDEDDYYEPIDVYGWTKKHTEEIAKFYAKKMDFPVINIRLANAAGYGETNLKLLGEILSQISKGRKEIKLGNLSPRRDYINVEDIAWVVEKLIDANHVSNGNLKNFNVGTGYEPISVAELFDLVNKAHGGGLTVIEDEKRIRPPDQERELLAININRLLEVLPEYSPKKIDEWIGDLSLNPGLRIDSKFIDDIYLKD